MTLKTIDFINVLSKNDDVLNNAKRAFLAIKGDFDIGKIVFYDGKKAHFIFDDEKEDFETFEYVSDDFRMVYYKVNKYFWTDEDKEDLVLYAKIFEIEYKKYIADQKAKEIAYINVLTNLPNKVGYLRFLKQKSREELKDYTTFFINLHNFTIINKAFGQEQGDEAIKAFAKYVAKFMDEGEILSHFGGDNFAALVKTNRAYEFTKYFKEVKVSLKNSGSIIEIHITALCGAYNIRNGFNEIGELISYPAIALQYTKTKKRKVTYLTDGLKSILGSAKKVEQIFDDELRLNHFIPFYQPKVDLRTGKIIGSEALARWVRNDKIIPPAMFIPTLETSGKIHKLDLYILECVCQDIKFCHEHGYNTVPVSVNVSRKDLLIEDFDKNVLKILDKYNIKTEEIIIEVTETSSIDEQSLMFKFINSMNDIGLNTSIDDFGTGYSSLSVLRDFRVTEIKIDRSFINREKLVESDEIIISSIIEMARKLNINVICEGVESQEQATFLANLGCYQVQGFLFDEPLNKEEYWKRLIEGKYIV